jgi:methyl-accepting chemotaxis protein
MLSKFKIGPRLGAAFLLIVILLMALAGVGFGSLSHLANQFDTTVNENNKKLALSQELRENLNVAMRSIRNVLLYHSNENFAKAQEKRISKAYEDFDHSYEQMNALLRNDEERHIFAEIGGHREAALKLVNGVIAAAQTGNIEGAAKQLKEEVQPKQNDWYDSIQAMIAFQDKQNGDMAENAKKIFTRTMFFFIAFTSASIVLAIALAAWITRSITKPLDNASQVAHSVATGDLSSHIGSTSRDETGELLRTLQHMQERLTTTVTSVRKVAAALTDSSGQLVDVAHELNESSSQQSSAVSSSAASVEEIAASIESVAGSASEIRALAKSSQSLTRESSENLGKLFSEIELLGSTVEAISNSFRDFAESSKSISGMTSYVRELSEQTNLLALNAAIEAARAGEQGRGFAVVADEVRKLAEKSGKSVNEIDAVNRTLNDRSEQVAEAIVEGVRAIESSKRHVQTVMKSLAEADEAAFRTAEGINHISVSTNEQSTTSMAISENMAQIAAMTDEYHAAVERTGEAANGLRKLSDELTSSVAHFRLGG